MFNVSFLETDRPFSKDMYHFTFQPEKCKDSDVSISAETHNYLSFIIAISVGIEWQLIVASLCMSPMANDVEHLSMYLLPICVSFFIMMSVK